MGSVYRDAAAAVRFRRDELLARNARALDGALRVGRIHERRFARTAAGCAGIVMAAVMAGCALATTQGDFFGRAETGGHVARLLLAAWGVMTVVYAGARLGARARLRAALQALVEPAGDVFSDLARLEREGPVERARAMAAAAERRSIAVPMIAVALLAPLTMHFPIGLVANLQGDPFAELDWWIGLSVRLVGHCHLVLGFLCWRHAKRLAALAVPEVPEALRRAGWRALGIVTASSFVPGVLFFGLPVMIVAATGLVLCPALFRVATRTVESERRALAL